MRHGGRSAASLSFRAVRLDMERCLALQEAMRQELARSMKGLQLPNEPPPFFGSYLMHAADGLNVWGRYGTVFHSEPFHDTDLYAEFRVGDYDYDQTIDGGITSELHTRDSYNWIQGPEELTPAAVRYALWKLSQLKYEEALQDYYDKRKVLIEQHLAHSGNDFSREKRLVHNEEIVQARFPKKRWEDFVRETSEVFRDHRSLLDPFVRLRGENRVRVFVNSEGTRFICQEQYYEVILKAWYLTQDGSYLTSTRLFYGRSRGELPSREEVREAVDDLARDISELARAEPGEPYAGPALLSGLASGLIFHEAIGHRLEAERLASRLEGHTFANKVGQRILPTGIDVFDDPTLSKWQGQGLYGHYAIDDEGVVARPVQLVEDGVLKTFLASRQITAAGVGASNGHGRHERFQDPMARMANLVVKCRNGHSWDELQEMLLEQLSASGLEQGILVRGVSGGETRTDRYEFQAFKGEPTEVFTVSAKTGKSKRIRGVSFIGTPLAATQSILAVGRESEVDNSYCFAESGSVPVSTIAPPMLVEKLELQRAKSNLYRRPVLRMPRV